MILDYYNILGIAITANQLEIKLAYRRLAKEHHPDKHGGDKSHEEIFKLVNEAYMVLSQPDKKITYDKQLYYEQVRSRSYSSRDSYQPYQYAPRSGSYATTEYVYSKWTLMYGKIFVVLLIMFVILFPIMLEYWFSIYFYNEGMRDLQNQKHESALMNFDKAMRDLGGKNTEAAIRGAEIMESYNSNFEVLSYTRAGLSFAVKSANKARLYYLQGKAQDKLLQSDKAEESYKRALFWHFDMDSVYKELAPLYAYKAKKYRLAATTYDSLVLHHPENPDFLLHRGFCYQKIGEHKLAIDNFSAFLNYDGFNGSAFYLKAISQLSLNQKDSACINFHLALDNGIQNATTFITLNCKENRQQVN